MRVRIAGNAKEAAVNSVNVGISRDSWNLLGVKNRSIWKVYDTPSAADLHPQSGTCVSYNLEQWTGR